MQLVFAALKLSGEYRQMPFRTSIHDYEVHQLFRRFQYTLGESNWRQRVKKLKEEIREANSCGITTVRSP